MRWVVLWAWLAAGCGAEEPPPEPATCAAPHRIVEGRCLAPGTQDDGCPAGSLAAADATCRPAGMTPEMCAAGFTHDGEVGCEPLLPASCPPGQLAVPGDATCHAVMDCAPGTWGDIPIDATTEHVDAAYAGGNSDGSAGAPWTTIGEAITAAAPDALVAIAEGQYLEELVVTKPVRIRGVCPERVVVVGWLDIIAPTELVGVALTGPQGGVLLSGSTSVLLARIWVHDSGDPGVAAQPPAAGSLVLEDSLIERTSGVGVFVAGAEARIERTVVRDTAPVPANQMFGGGIFIQEGLDSGAPANATVVQSVVANNHHLGVLVAGSDAHLEGVVIRDTQPQASDQLFGRGISVQDGPGNHEVQTTVVGSLLERNHEMGAFIGGSRAHLEAVVVRDTLPNPAAQGVGRGITARHGETDAPSHVTVASSLFARNQETGILVIRSEASFEGVVVRDSFPRQGDQLRGRGIAVFGDALTGVPARATITGSRVERAHDMGVFVAVAEAEIRGVVVSEIAATAEQRFGDGVGVVANAVASLHGSLVQQSARAGVSNFGAVLSLESSALQCASLDLAAEAYDADGFIFDDLGGNGCGCPEALGECTAVSAGLEAPDAISE